MFYYYIQLSRLSIHNPDVRQSVLYPNYAALECFELMQDKDIDKYKLVYIGRGYVNDKHIQNNLRRISNAL